MMYYVIRLILVFSLRAPDARRLTTKFNRQNRRILQVPDPIRHSPPHSSSLILRRIRYLPLRVHISTGRPDVADTVKGPLDYKAYTGIAGCVPISDQELRGCSETSIA